MMTLKTILKNFLNYADTLEAQKKLGKDLYEVDFQKLKALTEQLKRDKDYASSEGLKEVNRRKNRYKDILPYDYTRVILSEYPGVPGSDFINANYIKGASGSLAYIASQGPLPNTVVDFWRMIWECEVQVIVMACNEQESGKYKCECYWPIDDEKKQYGNINIEFVKWRQVCPDFLVRTLKACWENEERVICQFHYTTWPDHGVPNSVQPILELVRLIRDCQASEAVPVLIHCSAGCGRTGTICAIDYVWGLMRMGKLSKQFNLYNVIADMRRQRIAMVQTKEQYVLVHKAVSSLFEQQLRVIDSHTYENLDEDGEPLILKEMQEEDIYEDIMEPLVSEEYVSHGEKSSEWKRLPPKPFHDNGSFNTQNMQVVAPSDIFALIPSPVTSANHANEINSPGEMENKNNTGGVNLEQILSEADAEFESSSRNSKILLKLCREESVKRLISGWNRAVEKSDDPKIENKESSEIENAAENKPLSVNNVSSFSHSPNDQKAFKPEYLDSRENTTYSVGSCNVDNTSKSDEHSHSFEKDITPTTSPRNLLLDDGNHTGKLIGKATVIRRPSIAKLKALFEKSPQEGHDTERQRRPLFRSHSHHVSNSNRIFTVSDNVDHQGNSNCYASVSDHTVNSASVSSTNAQNVSSSSEQKDNILSPCWNQNSPIYGQCSSQRHSRHYAEGFVPKQKYYDQSKDICNRAVEHGEHRMHCPKHKYDSKSSDSKGDTYATNAAARNESTDSKDSSLILSEENHSYNCCASQTISKVKLKQSQSLGHQKKDVPPELPAKRKPAAPSIHMLRNKPDSNSRSNTMKENQCDQEKNSKLEQNEKSGIKKTEKLIKTFFKSSTSGNQKHSHNTVSQSWSSPLEHGIKESRRNSHEAVQSLHGTFHKHQSFSDPEQAEARTIEPSKQKDSKIINSEVVASQSTSIGNKAQSYEASPLSDEGAYTNVNSFAEKNIQQIENKLKSHPRGAIIDLTSRKSYIDEVSGGNNKHFVFRNTIQPVKFSPALESQDLTACNYKNRKKTENKSKETELCKDSLVPKSNSCKVERTLKDSEIDSKNLLLHSPPPKSKRGHSSKSKSNPPSSSSSSEILEVKLPENNQTSNGHSGSVNSSNSQSTQPISNFSSSPMSSGAADRSDPRYFPVTRQTASEAKYECEKQKATSIRDGYNVPRPVSSYEPLYSTKQASYAYHKAAISKQASETYGKKSPNLPIQSVKYSQESSPANTDKEPLYGLQRSASGPQILPGEHDNTQAIPPGSDSNKMCNSYHQLNEDIVKKQHIAPEPPKVSHYEHNPSFGLYGMVGTPNPYPVGPPKPPRTFHYDSKSNVSEHERNIKRDSGRYFVPVASPKHSISSAKQHAMTETQTNAEYRYGERRHPEQSHDGNTARQGYAVSPQNEVPMSRSYPFTHYDAIYGHPRPYGKQFHPDAIEFRNVHVPPYPSNSIYVTAKEKPISNQQCLYGTIKHRNAFSEYENVYNPQLSYKQSNTGIKKESQDVYQSINSHGVHGHQRSQSENNNVYSVLRPPKPPAYPPHNAVTCDFNYGMENSADNVLSQRKVYFDTLQRRHKQRVTWEQRRSHDDMDIHSAQSSRLREQIHARRSMVELDNLEITIASDEGYAEKGFSNLSPLSSQAPMAANERSAEVSQKTKGPSFVPEFNKDSHFKKNSAHNKESGSFGETLSKAFGKLTSKFNSKEVQSSHSSSENGNSGPKTNLPVKQKEKEKPNPNCINQSPQKSRESGPHSEQWTQV